MIVNSELAQDVNNFVEQQRAHITMGRAYVASVDQDDSEEKDENSESHSNFNIDSATALRKAYECYKTAYKLLSEDELVAVSSTTYILNFKTFVLYNIVVFCGKG